jgi:hypothetical protein
VPRKTIPPTAIQTLISRRTRENISSFLSEKKLPGSIDFPSRNQRLSKWKAAVEEVLDFATSYSCSIL